MLAQNPPTAFECTFPCPWLPGHRTDIIDPSQIATGLLASTSMLAIRTCNPWQSRVAWLALCGVVRVKLVRRKDRVELADLSRHGVTQAVYVVALTPDI